MKLRKTFLWPFVIVIASIFPYRSLLSEPGIVGHTWDWGLPPFGGQFSTIMTSYFFSWNPSVTLGNAVTFYNDMYFWMILFAFSPLGGEAISKGIVVGLTCLSGISMFYLCKSIGVRSSLSIVPALFYMFSPLLYSRFIAGHLTAALGYSLLPLAIASLLAAYRTGQISWAVFSGIILVLGGQSSFVMADSLLAVVAIFALSFLLGQKKNAVRATVVVFAVFIGLNSYWLFPLILNSSVALTTYKGRTVVSEIAFRIVSLKANDPDLLYSVRGIAPSGMFTEFVYPVDGAFSGAWTVATYLLSGFAFLSLLLRPRDKRVLTFGILAVIGITLTSITKTMLGLVAFNILLQFEPLLAMFTNPYRFAFLLPLAYGPMIAISCESMYKWWRTKQPVTNIEPSRYSLQKSTPFVKVRTIRLSAEKYSMPAVFLGVLLTSVLITGLPYLNGQIISPAPGHPSDQPFDLQVNPIDPRERVLYNFLRQQAGDFRVVYLPPIQMGPPVTSLGIPWQTYVSPAPEFLGGTPLDVQGRAIEQFVISTLYQTQPRTQNLGQLLGLANVKYVFLPNYGKVLYWYPFTQDALLSNLANQKDLSVVQVPGLYNITTWSNTNWLPHIRLAKSIDLVSGADLTSLISLSSVPGFDYASNALIYSSQLSPSQLATANQLASSVIFYNNNYFDSVVDYVPSQYIIAPGQFAQNGTDPERSWVNLEFFWYADWHYSSQLDKFDGVYTHSSSSLALPFIAGLNDTYDIYASVALNSASSSLHFEVDGQDVGNLTTRVFGLSSNYGFRWMPVGEISLIPGTHELTLTSDPGFNAVRKMAIIPHKLVNQAISQLETAIENKSLILIAEAEQFGLAQRDSQASQGFAVPLPAERNSNIAIQGFPFTYDLNGVTGTGFTVSQNRTFDIYANFAGINHGDYVLSDNFGNGGINTTETPYLTVRWKSTDHVARVVALTDRDTYKIVPYGYSPDVPYGGAYSPNWTETVYPLPPNQIIRSIQIGVDSDGFSVKGVQHAYFQFLNLPDVSQSMYIPRGGSYQVFARTRSPTPFELTTVADDASYKFQNPESDQYEWYPIAEVQLSKGFHTLQYVSNVSGVHIDEIMLRSLETAVQPSTGTLGWTKDDPTRYSLAIDSSTISKVIFSEAYDSNWKLQLGEKSFESLPAYGFINLFFVNDIGHLSLTLSYAKQIYFQLGQGITAGSWVSIMAFACVSLLRRRRK